METGQVMVSADFTKRKATEGESTRALFGQHHQVAERKADSVEGAQPWWVDSGSDYRLIEPLTNRELRFLDCLASGISNKEIARNLCVSENTVKFHLKNVYSKFAVRTRLQAIKAAYELGVLTPPANAQRPAMTGAAS